jgi:glutathione S-transferase
MEALAIVTVFALIQSVFFAFQVGKSREEHGVTAPLMTGPDGFLRDFRVHMNTVENLVVFIPALWMFGYFVGAYWAAGIGLVYVISRFMYRAAYTGDPAKRSLPFTIGLACLAILLLGTIVGAVMSYMANMAT